MSTARRANGRHAPLAKLHSWFQTIDPEWWTVSVNFKSADSQVLTVGQGRWRVDFSLYGVRWGWTRDSQIRYQSSITLSPWRVSAEERARLARTGWYDQMTTKCRKLGYRGKWHRLPDGRMGIFQRRLRSLADVKAEVARLDGFRL